MARMEIKEQELDAYFLANGFVLDEVSTLTEALIPWKEAFDNDKYKALFHLGFLTKEKWFSPSMEYLHKISETLIKKLSQQPEIELVRDMVQAELTEDEIYQFKDEIPFVIGMEYVDDNWLLNLWESILAVFKSEIKSYDGTVARYFADYNSNINVVGRVFFHLVENKNEEYPFAFMATYTTKTVKSKRAIHTPLKNALSEFKGDEKNLI